MRTTSHRFCPRPVRRLAQSAVAGVGVALLVVAGAAAAGASSPLPLTARVLTNGYAGMKPSKPPVVIRDVTTWADGQTGYIAMLRREGFVAGIQEQLSTPGNGNRYGLSLVLQLSSPAGAAAELKSDYTTNGPWIRFAVPGIPGAVGFDTPAKGASQGGRNVGFTIGPYLYLVGAGWQSGAKNAVPRATVIAAARLIYQRVH